MTTPTTLEQIQQLVRFGRVHTLNRQRSIRSHVKDVFQHFTKFNYEEFVNYVFYHYTTALMKGEKFSIKYLLNKIATIKRISGVRFFGKRAVYRIINNINKIINPMATTDTFFTNKGVPIQLNSSDLQLLREKRKEVLEKRQMFRTEEGGITVSQLYTEADCEFLVQHYFNHLKNFIGRKSGSIVTAHDDLAMVVTFIAFSPRRVNEITRLTFAQWEELIARQTTKIQSKSGTSPTNLNIPVQLAEYMQGYLNVLNVSNITDEVARTRPVIRHSYQLLLKALKETTKDLLKRRVERPFHGFRNYFALKYRKKDYENTKRALGHSSRRMTRMYANKQQYQDRYLQRNAQTSAFLAQNSLISN